MVWRRPEASSAVEAGPAMVWRRRDPAQKWEESGFWVGVRDRSEEAAAEAAMGARSDGGTRLQAVPGPTQVNVQPSTTCLRSCGRWMRRRRTFSGRWLRQRCQRGLRGGYQGCGWVARVSE